MRRHLWFAAFLIALVLPLSAQTTWQQIPIPALPAFHPREPKRIELSNGMVIFLQEDHELPLIEAVARIRGGSRSEPAAKTGMLDMYGEVWRTGGTQSQTGDQLDDYLEARAAKVETNSNDDSTSISLSCLKADFDDVFKVFLDVLKNPAFRDDKLKLAKDQYTDAISRRNDDVGEIAGREAAKLAYGVKNPYAREAEYATVAAVTRDDLIEWHHARVYPNNIIVGIVGDFDSSQMEASFRQAFGSWGAGPAVPKKEDIAFQPAKPGYYLVTKDDVNQSNIRMVALGVRRDNPDYYAITVFNEAFGGGFSARLMRKIRTEKGLAYSVGGGIGTAFDHPGILRLSMGTKSESTVESIQALYDEIDNLRITPISEEEIKRAKDSILNGFIFNFDSPDKVLRERMAYEFYGYPPDFLERYRAAIEKVQAADVNRVAAKYLHKDQLAVLVVGNPHDFDKPISSLGSVTNVDITIPPPPGAEAPAKPAASNQEGKSLAAQVVKSMGGEAKLKTIHSLRVAFSIAQKGPSGEVSVPMESTIVFPDRMFVKLGGAQAGMTVVVSPNAGFMAMGDRSQNLPSAQKAESIAQIKRDPVYIGQHLNDPAFIFAAGGTQKIGDIDARILDVSGDGIAIRWFVDPKTGNILSETYQALGQNGPYQAQTDFSDWKTTDGVTLPYVHSNKQEGQYSSVATFTKVEFNPQVNATLFEKPAPKAPAQ
jgi:zinc protease